MSIATRIEKAFGADLTANPATWTWTDVSTYALGSVSVTAGRADEAGQTAPTRCTFRLRNTDGRFSPRLPTSPYYPFVRRQTPVRVSLNPGTGYVQRFQGYVDEIVPTWPSGNSDYAEVVVTASDIMRRLLQGNNPTRSALARSILGTTAATLRQYWPCEDGSSATRAASAIPAQPPLAVAGTVAFAAMDYEHPAPPITLLPGTRFGTQKLPQFKSGGGLNAAFSAGSATSWTVQAAVFDDVSSNGLAVAALEWSTTDGSRWRIWTDPTVPSTWVTRNGVTIATVGHLFVQEDLRVDAAQSGGDIAVTLNVRPNAAGYQASGTVVGATLAGVNGVNACPDQPALAGEFSVGHIRVWDGNSAPDFKTSSTAVSAWNGWPGEIATDRLTRLCAEQGVLITVTGTSTTTMGVQGVDTFLNLLREVETADIGILYAGFGPGLSYLARPARENLPVSLALDTKRQQVKLPFSPTEDDQRIRNDWTVSRPGGTFAQFTDPVHIAANGLYDTSATLNLASDGDLLYQAQWRGHLGTVEEMRVPGLSLQLIDRPELWAAWLATTLGARVTAANLPAQYPPGVLDMIVEGYTETWDSSSWKVDLNTSPFAPWRIFQIAAASGDNGEFVGHLDTDGSTLQSGINATIASIGLVTAATNALWTTVADDFPFDINIDGERMTVTNITGAASPQTGTVTRSVNGVVKTHLAGAVVSLYAPLVLGL